MQECGKLDKTIFEQFSINFFFLVSQYLIKKMLVINKLGHLSKFSIPIQLVCHPKKDIRIKFPFLKTFTLEENLHFLNAFVILGRED